MRRVPQLDACSPREVLARWPRGDNFACLWASAAGLPHSRWLLLAADEPGVVSECFDDEALDALGWERGPSECGVTPDPDWGGEHPPGPGWFVTASYELGARLEPKVGALQHGESKAEPRWERKCTTGAAEAGESGEPHALALRRCERGLWFDTHRGEWWWMGRPELNATMIARLRGDAAYEHDGGGAGESFVCGELRSVMGRAAYEHAAARVIEYIRAGDVYQVNLAHGLEGTFEGSAVGLFAAWAARFEPWFGGCVVRARAGRARAVVSMSPELFIQVQGRRVVTRPMKGTRPAGSDPAELRESAKDSAELAMIVDLMRNDLGRVCRFGSMRVDTEKAIEAHGGIKAAKAAPTEVVSGVGTGDGVWQAVSTVSGELREGITRAALLRAVFPGGSVTGAPKIRAMQIIRELEAGPRGPYCGSFGFAADSGWMRLNILIRTAVIEGPSSGGSFQPGSTLRYHVGAGVVADSDPHAEWRETLVKANVVRSSARIVDDR